MCDDNSVEKYTKQKIKYKDNTETDEKTINLPYNKKNVFITEKIIEDILLKFNIKVKVINLELFQIALTHKSYIEKNIEFTPEMLNECDDYPNAIPLQKKSYEMLEFYGDSVADRIVRKYLCYRYPNEDEGVLTKIKTNIVDTNTFSKFTRVIGITPYILISKQLENLDNGLGRSSDEFRKILEDVFESFIGALDQGIIDLEEFEMRTECIDEYIEYKQKYKSPCEKLIIQLMESHIDFAELFFNDTNYKNRLLQYYHKQQWGYPIYGVEEHDGPAHKRMFRMYVLDKDGNKIAYGDGRRKKDGEQNAAREALIQYGQIEEEELNRIDITTEIFI